MANNINLSFSNEKKGFFLRITEKGKSNGLRAKVKNLRNPNFDCWDKKRQKFVEASTDAIHNNSVLREMLCKYQTVLNTCNPQSPAELKQLVETGEKVEAVKPVTLGSYLESLIHSMKTETCPHNGSSYIGMPLSLLPFAGHRVHSVWLFPCHIHPCSVHILFQPVFPLRQYVPCSQ